MAGIQEHLVRLTARRDQVQAEIRDIITTAEQREGEDGDLNKAESTRFRELKGQRDQLDDLIAEQTEELERSGKLDPDAAAVRQTSGRTDPEGGGGGWAQRAAHAIGQMGGESRAMTSGSVDVPNLLAPNVTPKARPDRLTDLLVNRVQLTGNAFEYYRQTVRTNLAAPVADAGLKPTSAVTMEAVSDRARVIGHLSEPTPVRLLQDVPGLEAWLDSEMAEGVLDALEAQVITGDGTGENFEGVTVVSGTTPVSFATDVITSIRKGITAAQNAGDSPNAVVVNPATAETVDLLRWGASGGFLIDGYASGNDRSANVFGDPGVITRVISPSCPTGVAILGDWSRVQIGVREAVRLDLDLSGDLFTHNQFIARAEGRFGIGWLRPASFYIVDLTA